MNIRVHIPNCSQCRSINIIVLYPIQYMVSWVNIRIIECPIKSHVAHQPLNCLHPESYIIYRFQGSSCGFHMSGVQNTGDIRLHWLNQTDPYTGFICSLCSRLGSLTLQSPPLHRHTHTHTKHNYNIGHCHCPFFFGAYPTHFRINNSCSAARHAKHEGNSQGIWIGVELAPIFFPEIRA